MEWKIDSPSALGVRIRERRRQLGLTQASLAGVARVTTRVLGEIENGKASAQLDGVLRVLAALGLDVYLRSR
jgi:HTH-type transcriptional regulator/antitoxin HipB